MNSNKAFKIKYLCSNKMMNKQNYLSSIATLCALVVQFIPMLNKVMIAQEYAGCFMVNGAGQVMNLNNLCSDEQQRQFTSESDQGFIEDYKRLLMPYPEETRNILLADIERSPTEKIAQAKSICSGIQSGISVPELRLRTLNESRQMQDFSLRNRYLANMEIIMTLAPNYYCPDVVTQ